MKGRKINKESKIKIINAKLENPNLSVRQIEDMTGISKSTIANTINNVPEIMESLDSTDKAKELINTMDSIINDIADMTSLSMVNFKEKVINKELGVKDIKDLNDIAKNNFERKQILEGKPTEIIDVNDKKEIKDMTDDEIAEYLKNKLSLQYNK